MKGKQILITTFTIAMFAVSCKPVDNQPKAEQVKEQAQETAQATKEYAFAQKDEYVAKMKLEVAELNTEMDQLAAKVENASGATKDEAKARLQALRDKTAELGKQLDGAGNATESTWEAVKANFKKGYEEAKDSFNQARTWLGEKIAP